jgi:hypothetical protein
MFKDLYINGTSVATGWGQGKEQINDTTYTGAWPHQFAEKHNVGNMWNHSIPSKPVELSIRDQKGFCEQYIQQGNNVDNLFTIVEFLLPQHPLLQPVYENDEDIIFPLIFHQDPLEINFNKDQEYLSYYAGTKKQPNYMSNEPIYTMPEVDVNLRSIHEEQKIKYYTEEHNLSKRLYNVFVQIGFLQRWLHTKGIKFLMFWACGGNELKNNNDQFAKLVDKAMLNLPYKHRFIPMTQFSCMNYGVLHSLKSNLNHPDAVGQHHIAEYLDKYIISNNILQKDLYG